MTRTINKDEVLRRLDMERDKWKAIKRHDQDGTQDVTHDNFIDNVILIYEWVIKYIEKL